MAEQVKTKKKSWVRGAESAAWKLHVGLDAEDWAIEHGGLVEWFTKSNQARERERICDTYRGAEDTWRTEYAGADKPKGFGNALVHRARHCLPPEMGGTFNEIAAFRSPGAAHFLEFVTDIRSSGKTVVRYDIFEAQERVVLAAAAGLPGLYVKVHAKAEEDVDVGYSGDIKANNEADAPRGIFTACGYPTLDRKTARELETDIHATLRNSKLIEYTKGDFFSFKRGINGVQKVDELLHIHHRSRLKYRIDFCGVLRRRS